ncbi:hypothetical protein C8F01DRAFT_1250596 [Mycena amicta]|nr:hypothetical protein C8F01DRAFT_1250596 [Mycena amicta]
MGAFDDAFGALLVGTWIASLLFGSALSQAVRYYRTVPSDTWPRQGLVAVSVLFCTVALVGDYANAYLPMVTYWGNVEAVQRSYWPLPVYGLFNSSVGLIVDSYLISRFYSLSKNLFISLLLGLLVLTSITASFTTCIMLQLSNSIAERDKVKVSGVIWTTTMAVSDVAIAVALVWKLQGMRTTFKETNSLIHRLTMVAVQTGATTSVVAILLMITYLVNPTSNVPTLFCYQLGPCYLHTLLYNVNLKRDLRSRSGTRTTSATRNNNILMEGIHVHRTAIVTGEGPHSDLAQQRSKINEVGINGRQDLDVESFAGGASDDNFKAAAF